MNRRTNPIANREGYDLWSADYDAYPNPTVAMDERHFPSQWRHLVGRRVLEVGCGTGRHTLRLARQGNRVTGLDLSRGMLAIAREKLKDYGDVRLVEADFLSAQPPRDQGFEAVVAALVLEHVKHLPVFFNAARSALEPGGELHVSEIHPARAAQGILAHFKTADGIEFDLDSVPHPDGALESAASQAGFQLIEIRDSFGDQELAKLNPKWAKHLGVPMTRMWHWKVSVRRRAFRAGEQGLEGGVVANLAPQRIEAQQGGCWLAIRHLSVG